MIGRADIERRDIEFMLPVQVQNSSACHHDLKRRGGTQQVADEGRNTRDLLYIIQHEQEFFFSQKIFEQVYV